MKDEVYNTFFQRKSIQVLVKLNQLALLVVNIEKEEIVQWTS
ncbi:MAG: element excision factor XisH family protein [Pseudanabaena sp.]